LTQPGDPAAIRHVEHGADEHSFHFGAMASDCEVRIAGCAADAARRHADVAINEVRRIEHKYSRYRDDSIVAQINAAAGHDERIGIDDETAQLLAFAGQLHAQSGGLFDITSGVLRQAWDFRAGRVPDAQTLASAVARIGWPQVELIAASADAPATVRLPRAGMEIDFGGFGKEYAADRAAALLHLDGVRSGLVNLGGDLQVIGPRPDGSAWSIAIQHPRDATRTIASIALARGALATSGDYERYFEVDGRRYCHVLDPRSGWPVTAWQSISVVAPLCVAAGALCTIAMLHEAAALDFLRAQHVAFLTVDAAGAMTQQGFPAAATVPGDAAGIPT